MVFFFAELLEKAVSRLLHVDRSQHGERVEIRRRLFRLAGVTVSEHGRFMPSASSMLEVLHHMSRAGECRVFHGAHRTHILSMAECVLFLRTNPGVVAGVPSRPAGCVPRPKGTSAAWDAYRTAMMAWPHVFFSFAGQDKRSGCLSDEAMRRLDAYVRSEEDEDP
jgi:hypothetical protein